jgi:hypothetical protein
VRECKLSKLAVECPIEALDLVIDHVIVKADVMIADYNDQFSFASICVKQLLDTIFIILPLKLTKDLRFNS